MTLVQKVENEMLQNREFILQEYNHAYYEKKARGLATSKDDEYGYLLAEMLNRDLDLNLNLTELLKKDVSPLPLWNSDAQPITAPTTQNNVGKYEVRRSTEGPRVQDSK